jgi:hypothetical protein
MLSIVAMAFWIEEARSSAAGLPLFSIACVIATAAGCMPGSGEQLFPDEVSEPADRAVMPAAVQTTVEPESQVPVTNTVFVPEQLIGAVRDVAPAGGVPAAGGGAEQQASPEPALPEELVPDPCAAVGMLVCDGFETEVNDAFPLAGGWLPELAGCGTHRVDGAGPAASGSKALRVDEGGYPECMLHAELSGEDDVFVRTRVFLGAEGSMLDQYVSLLEFGSRPAQDDPELRIGLRPAVDSSCPGMPGVDVSGSGLTGAPATECTGFVLEPERWYCMEGHLTRTGRNLSLSLSVDGTELLTRDFVGAAVWAGSDLYLKLGRAAYGASGPGSLWHDDVAVSREPLPCDP